MINFDLLGFNLGNRPTEELVNDAKLNGEALANHFVQKATSQEIAEEIETISLHLHFTKQLAEQTNDNLQSNYAQHGHEYLRTCMYQESMLQAALIVLQEAVQSIPKNED